MVVNGLLNIGIVLFGLGLLLFYGITWVVLFFLLWAQVDDGAYVFASVLAAGLLLWTGIGIVVVGLVI